MTLRTLAETLRGWWRPRPAMGPATHDYSQIRGYGHDVAVLTVLDGGQRIRVAGWGCGITVGDFVLLTQGDGVTRYRVIGINYMCDPADQWFAWMVFAPRAADGR